MPTYEYDCAACGPFEESRPMAEYDQPQPCPGCGALAPRAIFSVPAMAMMDGAARTAHATNERSANAPRRAHAGNCGCCRPSKLSAESVTGPALKSAGSNQRPWMVGH
jgi:putative FmdB family regulatory protein